jgi:tripartite-type tricarboxylate transporter receptor subunit TctC
VRLVVSQPPGTPPDIIARILADRLAKAWAQPIIVDNRAGGANIIGAQAAARSPADGYHYFFATTAALVTNLYAFKKLPYDPVRDFAPVGMVGMSPFMLVANTQVPARSIAELVSMGKSQPGKLSFASDGQRLLSGMMGEALNHAAGLKAVHVPYNGSAPALQDTVAGRTQFVLMGLPAVVPLVNRGQLRAMAVTSAQRLPGLENVPTIAEAIPGFEFAGWFALVAPAGIPDAIVQRVNRDLDRVLHEKDTTQRLRELGIYTDGAGSPQALAGFIGRERNRWGKTMRLIGIQPE